MNMHILNSPTKNIEDAKREIMEAILHCGLQDLRYGQDQTGNPLSAADELDAMAASLRTLERALGIFHFRLAQCAVYDGGCDIEASVRDHAGPMDAFDWIISAARERASHLRGEI
jgi:hypothetical protein